MYACIKQPTIHLVSQSPHKDSETQRWQKELYWRRTENRVSCYVMLNKLYLHTHTHSDTHTHTQVAAVQVKGPERWTDCVQEVTGPSNKQRKQTQCAEAGIQVKAVKDDKAALCCKHHESTMDSVVINNNAYQGCIINRHLIKIQFGRVQYPNRSKKTFE